MGIDSDFGWAFVKSQAGAAPSADIRHRVSFSVKSEDRAGGLRCRPTVGRAGFRITATSGTAAYLTEQGMQVDVVNKVQEGGRIVDHIKNGEVALVVNTVRTASGKPTRSPSGEALHKGVPYYTTMRGALAAVMGIEALLKKGTCHSSTAGVSPGKLSGASWQTGAKTYRVPAE